MHPFCGSKRLGEASTPLKSTLIFLKLFWVILEPRVGIPTAHNLDISNFLNSKRLMCFGSGFN